MGSSILLSINNANAFFPLIPLLVKSLGLGAKKHHLGKQLANKAQEIAKDEVKDVIKNEIKKTTQKKGDDK